MSERSIGKVRRATLREKNIREKDALLLENMMRRIVKQTQTNVSCIEQAREERKLHAPHCSRRFGRNKKEKRSLPKHTLFCLFFQFR